MEQDLTAASGSGTQTTTQDPQSATSGTLAPTSNALQSNSVNLNTGTGIKLNDSLTPTVNLQSTATSTTKLSSVSPIVKHHHTNGVLLGIFIAIFIAAIATFWQTTQKAKNTTA
jgi:capsular polysaccharide biosynthesis protein